MKETVCGVIVAGAHVTEPSFDYHSYLRKLREHSVATALARSVFPVPGGPYSKTPLSEIKQLLKIFILNRSSCEEEKLLPIFLKDTKLILD